MLRTALAATVAVAALGLAAAPAQAAPRICASNCSVIGGGSNGGNNPANKVHKPPNASQSPRAIAAHRVADPISKRIIDKLKKISGHFR